MGDDLIDTGTFIAVEEPYEPIEFVTPLQSIGRLADTISNSIYSLGNNLASISYQPPTEEERQAYENFIKAQQKREEKERDYEQFKEFTRILENSYYK